MAEKWTSNSQYGLRTLGDERQGVVWLAWTVGTLTSIWTPGRTPEFDDFGANQSSAGFRVGAEAGSRQVKGQIGCSPTTP